MVPCPAATVAIVYCIYREPTDENGLLHSSLKPGDLFSVILLFNNNRYSVHGAYREPTDENGPLHSVFKP